MSIEKSEAEEGADQTKNRHVFSLPIHDFETRIRAAEAAHAIIADPSQLWHFRDQVTQQAFVIEAGGDENKIRAIAAYTQAVGQLIESHLWSGEKARQLTIGQSTAILRSLPSRADQDTPQAEVQKNLFAISENVAAGFLNKRFARDRDWRGSVRTMASLMEAALSTNGDVDMLNKFFRIEIGDHPRVNNQHSLARLGTFLALRTADPSDEGMLTMGYDLEIGTSLIAEILGKEKEWNDQSNKYDVIALQYTTARDLFLRGIDPTSAHGRRMHKALILGIPSSKKDYDFWGHNLDYQRIAGKSLPVEIAEVAAQAKSYPDRVRAITNARIEGDKPSDVPGAFYVTTHDHEGREKFPHTVTHRPSHLKNKIDSIIDIGIHKRKILLAAQAEALKHDPQWKVVKFNQRGMNGYLVVNPELFDEVTLASHSQRIARINNIMERSNLIQGWDELKKRFDDSTTLMIDWVNPNFVFLLAAEKLSGQSNLETLLDSKIPDEARASIPLILEEVEQGRSEIPRKFTRMVTRGGVRYDFSDSNLSNLLKEVVLRKDPGKGISFTINFVPDTDLIPNFDNPRARGSLKFVSERAELQFNGDAASLPLDLKIFLEATVLMLVYETCCVPLSEDEIELMVGQFLPESDEKKPAIDQEIPGQVVHVGGFRKSGERKQYTEQAEGLFAQAMLEMGRDTRGISLATINAEHRRQVPDCERYLTWNSGRELEIVPPPATRPLPEALKGIN